MEKIIKRLSFILFRFFKVHFILINEYLFIEDNNIKVVFIFSKERKELFKIKFSTITN